MKRLLFIYLWMMMMMNAGAQTPRELQETAKSFMKQGDYTNAVLVLNRARQMAPNDGPVLKDLALALYYMGEYPKALEALQPVVDGEQADDQSFQLAANIHVAMQQPKEAEKVYKKGLKKFPSSGMLYNGYGELLWAQKQFNAIQQWEKGIETDPSYPRNYYNACRYYYFTTDRVWSLIYGEIYLNMEPFGSATPEIKDILLEGYKKLFAEASATDSKKENTGFAGAFLKAMHAQLPQTLYGLNAETLTMIRTRFILDWFEQHQTQFPYKLFEYQQQLLRSGLFNAYNQWIFGSAQNLQQYNRWINAHPEEYEAFTRFQRSRVFKMPEGQFYK